MAKDAKSKRFRALKSFCKTNKLSVEAAIAILSAQIEQKSSVVSVGDNRIKEKLKEKATVPIEVKTERIEKSLSKPQLESKVPLKIKVETENNSTESNLIKYPIFMSMMGVFVSSNKKVKKIVTRLGAAQTETESLDIIRKYTKDEGDANGLKDCYELYRKFLSNLLTKQNNIQQQQLNQQQNCSTTVNPNTSGSGRTTSVSSNNFSIDQTSTGINIISIASNQQKLNDKIIQKMVAEIPNTILNKYWQRLIVDEQPKSPSETPPTLASGNLLASPTNSSKNAANNHNIEDISRIFCEVAAIAQGTQVIRSELNANPPSDFILHQKPCNSTLQQQFSLQQQQKQCPGSFINQTEDHIHMFTVEDSQSESIEECGMYPALEESLENLNADDVGSDGSRDQICNYEWADDIDVINVLHGVSEWPVALQEVAANCHEFADYANLIGINSSCKMRWTGGQWPQPTQMLADMSQRPLTGNVCDDPLGQRQQNQVMIDQQLHQQIQQQLCVEQFQLLNQLQNHSQQSPISLIPSAMELSQSPNQQIQNLPATGILQQQQSQTLSADAQQQTKFVFNVETDKTSPSLQLLFQLPSVQQVQQQQSSPSVNSAQSQQQQHQQKQLQQPCSNQAIAQATQGVNKQFNQVRTLIQGKGYATLGLFGGAPIKTFNSYNNRMKKNNNSQRHKLDDFIEAHSLITKVENAITKQTYYVCNVTSGSVPCLKIYTVKRDILTHLNGHNLGIYPHVCQICQDRFITYENLETHFFHHIIPIPGGAYISVGILKYNLIPSINTYQMCYRMSTLFIIFWRPVGAPVNLPRSQHAQISVAIANNSDMKDGARTKRSNALAAIRKYETKWNLYLTKKIISPEIEVDIPISGTSCGSIRR